MHKIIGISAFNDNYIWLIQNLQQQTCIVVDPGDFNPVFDFLNTNNCKLSAILITHHHADHTGGVAKLKQLTNAHIYAPKLDNINCDTALIGDETLNIDNFKIKILPTYGHTLGHISYLIDNNLFCGDTLFGAGCGRIFEGSFVQMFASINLIASLDPSTKIYCAHEYTLANLQFARLVEPNNLLIANRIKQVTKLRSDNLPSVPSTLLDELNTNPFLRCDNAQIIKSASNYAGKKLNSKLEVFSTLRTWKNNI